MCSEGIELNGNRGSQLLKDCCFCDSTETRSIVTSLISGDKSHIRGLNSTECVSSFSDSNCLISWEQGASDALEPGGLLLQRLTKTAYSERNNWNSFQNVLSHHTFAGTKVSFVFWGIAPLPKTSSVNDAVESHRFMTSDCATGTACFLGVIHRARQVTLKDN